MIEIIVFIFGSVIGSFLNVCIYRLPKNKSIVSPRSNCPHCHKSIPWYDNIPFISYLLLRCRCRFCKQRISLRYFIVELITALLFVLLFRYFAFSRDFLVYAALASGLIVISFIDLEYQLVPDVISLPGIIIGLAASLMPGAVSFFDSVLGVLAGGGTIYVLGLLGNMMFKKESMGGGDVKLLAMVGAFIGWKLVLLTFFIAPFFGSVVGIVLKIRKKAELMPYAPYLSLAAMVSILWGRQILDYLFNIY